MDRPRIKRTLELVTTERGDVYVLRPGEDSDLVIEQPDPAARSLLGRARRHAHRWTSWSASSAPSASRDGARRLWPTQPCSRTRPTTRATPSRDRARYDRQLRYFSDLAGGSLAALGVPAAPPRGPGADPRRGRARQLGLVRARVLRRGRARAAGRRPGRGEQLQPPDPLPRARHRPPEGRGGGGGARRVRLELPAQYRWRAGSTAWTPCARWSRAFDFVVNGADWPAHDIERWVNAACFELGVPFITMSHSPPVARVGPLYVPGTHRLLRVPGADLPRRAPALRRAGRAAPRPALRGCHARPGVRVRRRPGGARDAAPAHRPRARRRRSAWRTSTTCARCG